MSHLGWSARLTRYLAVACVLVLVVAGALWWVFRGANSRRITAYFSSAVGVYVGSDVRVLGVRVGSVDEVVPEGERVRVGLSVDRAVAVPEQARAVVVAPSVVSDRYVQLAPVYVGGPRLGDNAVIPRERTATPVELDQLYASLDGLATALGPGGANADGALSELLRTGAANLGGNGQALHDTIRRLGEATRTLSGSREDLFATVDSLRRFTGMLADNDTQVRQVVGQLAEVTGFLAGERDELAAALSQLATALGQVHGFVQDNRDHLKSNVDKLAEITGVLVDQRASVAEALDLTPLSLQNLINAYNPERAVLDSRTDINEFSMVNVTGCPAWLTACAPPLTRPGGQLPGGSPPDPADPPVLPLPSVGQVHGVVPGAGGSQEPSGTPGEGGQP